jgi:hypothetical protein
MRYIVSCDGPVQCKQLVVVQIRHLVGFVRKICFHHYIRIAISKQVHHMVAKMTHFTSVTFKIVVFVGCRRKLIWDFHTPLISRTLQNQWEWAEWLPRCSSTFHPNSLSQCNPPWHCKYHRFSKNKVVLSRSRSKFGNSPISACTPFKVNRRLKVTATCFTLDSCLAYSSI